MRSLCVLMILGAALPAADSKSSKLVAEISEQYWQVMLEDPGQRLAQGLPVDALPDVSHQHAVAEAGKAREMLARLGAINPSEITHDEGITVDELRWELNANVEAQEYFWLQPVITPYRSEIPVANRIFTTWQFKTATDADRYQALLNRYRGFIESVRSVLATQLARGIVLPKAEVALVDPFLAGYVQPPDKSLFYVSRQRLAGLPPAVADRFQAELARIIRSSVNPSLEELLAFLRGEYSAHAPETVGELQYPEGKEYYRFLGAALHDHGRDP
jgi:uncharacterized protein (DUF885 family)